MRILGWGVDRANGGAVKYWLAANSWGPRWGEQGHFRIVRGENHCEIESFVIGTQTQPTCLLIQFLFTPTHTRPSHQSTAQDMITNTQGQFPRQVSVALWWES